MVSTNTKRLTDRFVETASAGPTRVMYWDEVQKSFGLLVEPTEHKSYKLVYRLDGRSR